MKNSHDKMRILLVEPNYKNKYPPIGLCPVAVKEDLLRIFSLYYNNNQFSQKIKKKLYTNSSM